MCERNKKYTKEPQRINGGGLSHLDTAAIQWFRRIGAGDDNAHGIAKTALDKKSNGVS